jgi:nitrite reductase/ring-hydroxylating ferredoxin subunit
VKKILLWLFTLLIFSTCAKDQNTFLPYKKVDLYIPLANYNHLTIPGNSITFQNYGYAGIIVICINETDYYAFDACCPYEIQQSCIAGAEPIKNLSGGGLIYSSNTTAKCKCCGSEFMLFSGGFASKGPAARPLQQYQVVNSGGRLWVHN